MMQLLMPKRITSVTLLDLNDAFVSFVFCTYRVTQKKRNPILIILSTRVPFFLGHPVHEFLKIVFRLHRSIVQEPES